MANHLVFLVLDSCRYDSFVRASTPNIERIGLTERRWSYASWTGPSHYVMLMGLMPHRNPSGVYASEVYKEEFTLWVDRLAIRDMSFKTFIPELSLPKVLGELGYRCTARVSMPVLNEFTAVNRNFHDYRLMEDHNDFAGMVEEISFPAGGPPQFYFMNLGETHYPYMLTGAGLPRLSGVHGVFKQLARDGIEEEPREPRVMFDGKQMEELHHQQVRCVEYVDGLVGKLLDKCPPDTYFVVTSDHGELFGEDGFFGHGPIVHEKCFEVPFVEGKVG